MRKLFYLGRGVPVPRERLKRPNNRGFAATTGISLKRPTPADWRQSLRRNHQSAGGRIFISMLVG